MVKKTPAAPRAAASPAKTDVVTRVTAEAIAQHAYNLFQARGSENGHDVEDWLVAEAELLKGNNMEISPVSDTQQPKDTTWHR